MASRALVDWVAEEGLDRPARPVDDWTAGDDLDFTVRSRRRRITGDTGAPPRKLPDASSAIDLAVGAPHRRDRGSPRAASGGGAAASRG